MNRWRAACLVLALSLSGSSLFAQTTNPATVKLPAANGRHNVFLQRIAENNGAGDVVFLGDSITAIWDENFLDNSAIWQGHLGVFNPVNLGSGGDTTGHVLWRISDREGEGRELVNLNPRLAVLLIGINNINMGYGDNAQIADGIAAIVAELKRQKPGIKILVLGILPSSARAAPINALVSKLHDGESVFFKDIGSLLVDGTGYMATNYSPDRIHLNAAGYDVEAQAIKGDIARLTASTVAYHANGADSGTSPVSQTKTQNVAVVVPGNTGNLVKANRTFIGWNTAADGTGTDYVEGAAYSVNAPVTLYAKWVSKTPPAGGMVALGGTTTNYVANGTNYTAHIFTTSGQLLKVYTPVVVEYLVVGGGGGGGGGYPSQNVRGGGGGGAGGYRSSVGGETSGGGAGAETPLKLGAGTYEIGVGSGGPGGVAGRPSRSGSNGQDSYIKNPSSADLVRSAGGGGGAGLSTNNTALAGNAGGSGGGSTADGAAGSGTANQGYAGGVGGGGRVSGGGGGAGAVGLPSGSAGTDGYGNTYTKQHGGSGGTGVWSSITGSAMQRGGGGGGGRDAGSYENGMGGGGGGGSGGVPAVANTGSGGGGGSDQGNGRAGGSGIVIVRYVTGGG